MNSLRTKKERGYFDLEIEKVGSNASPCMEPSVANSDDCDNAPEEDDNTAFAPPTLEVESSASAWKNADPLPAMTQMGTRHIDYIRSLLIRMSVTPAYDREDILQEVLIQAHRSRDSPLDPRALLWGITRHVVFRWITKKQHERSAIQVYSEDDLTPDQRPTLEDERRAAQRSEIVHTAVDEIPPIFKEVFVRSELDDVRMPEVAEELGIPLNTGYTRLHLARGRFGSAVLRLMARRRILPEDLCVPVVVSQILDKSTRFVDVPAHQYPPPAELQSSPGAASHVAEVGRLGLLARSPWGSGMAVAATVTTALWLAPPLPSLEAPGAATTVVIAEAPSAWIDRLEPQLDDAVTANVPPAPNAPRAAPSASTSSAASRSKPRAATSAAPTPPPPAEGSLSRKILTLLCSGQAAEARQKAAELRRLYPNSSYISSIDVALAKGQNAMVDVQGCAGYRARPTR
jgi:RNA polymerase sigma-70 factor, ECF subfamily